MVSQSSQYGGRGCDPLLCRSASRHGPTTEPYNIEWEMVLVSAGPHYEEGILFRGIRCNTAVKEDLLMLPLLLQCWSGASPCA
eukprot:1243904-Amphidinium_carterae.1